MNSRATLDLLIIGAGLTGLTLAYRLRDSGLRIRVIEARDRLGGRIHTTTPSADLPPQEMGATWLHRPHQQMFSLLDELNLKTFEQVMGSLAIYEQYADAPAQLVQLPQNQEPSHRIQGGTSSLIHALAAALPSDWIQLNTKVSHVTEKGDRVEIQTSDGLQLGSTQVVSTLPPNLFLHSIMHEPSLPEELLAACAKTHTWMGASIRVSVAYRDPFWRKPNVPSAIFSNVGPLTEFYDHASVEGDTYALMGFVNGALYALSKAERRQHILAQLEKFYGPQAANFLAYNETVWRNEPFTCNPETLGLVPHQNNGLSTFRKCFWGNKLFIGGSETAAAHPGYMEGAVASGNWLAKQIERT